MVAKLPWGGMALVLALGLFSISLFLAVGSLDPIHYYDGWAYMEPLLRLHKDSSLMAYLEAIHQKHNEHRVGWVKLGLLADIYLAEGRLPVLKALNLAALSATGFWLGWLWSKGRGLAGRFALGLLCAAAMLAPTSIENTSWPTQLQFPMLYLSGIALMLAAAFIRQPVALALATFALSVSSVYSMGSGTLAFVSAAALLVLFKRDIPRALLVLAAGAAGAVLYFLPFEGASRHGLGFDAIAISPRTFWYATTYTGAAFRHYGVAGAMAIGCGAFVVITGFAAFALWKVWVRREPLDGVACAALGLGGYSLATALAVGLVRGSGDPTPYMLISRYATGSLVTVLVALILIARLVPRGGVLSILAGIPLAYGLLTLSHANAFIAEKHRTLNQVATSAQFGVADEELSRIIYPFRSQFRAILNDMKEARLGLFSARGSAQFTPPDRSGADMCPAGALTTLYRIAPAEILAVGTLPWAAFGKGGWVVARNARGARIGWTLPFRHHKDPYDVFRVPAPWPEAQPFDGWLEYVSTDGTRACRLAARMDAGRMFEVSGETAFKGGRSPATFVASLSGDAAQGGVAFANLFPDGYAVRGPKDVGSGRIVLDIDWRTDPDARLVIPVLSASEPKAQTVRLAGDVDGRSELIAALEPRFLEPYHWYYLSVPAAWFNGRTARLTVDDEGRGAGEWTAIGPPFWTTEKPTQPGL